MGLFSKKPKGRPRVIEPSALAGLHDLGRAKYQGGSVDPTSFYLSAFLAAGPPMSGTPEWQQFVDRLLSDLEEGAAGGETWTVVGAFTVAADFLGADLGHPRYVELVDRALDALSAAGVPSQEIPPFALRRWHDTRA